MNKKILLIIIFLFIFLFIFLNIKLLIGYEVTTKEESNKVFITTNLEYVEIPNTKIEFSLSSKKNILIGFAVTGKNNTPIDINGGKVALFIDDEIAFESDITGELTNDGRFNETPSFTSIYELESGIHNIVLKSKVINGGNLKIFNTQIFYNYR